jgi:hypothetical protein
MTFIDIPFHNPRPEERYAKVRKSARRRMLFPTPTARLQHKDSSATNR